MVVSEKFKLNPTEEQRQYFVRACGIARFTWNWAFYEYKDAKARGERANWAAIQRKFTVVKAEKFNFVSEVTKSAYQVAFQDLRQTITAYYTTKRNNPKSKVKFPKLRSKKKGLGGFGIQNDRFSISGNYVKIPCLGKVNISHQPRFQGKILSGRVKEKNGNFYFIVTYEIPKPEPLNPPNDSVGIDFGFTTHATLSNGEIYETQGYFRKAERKLKMLQRRFARKAKGSKNRLKTKRRLAKLHGHVANQRKDFNHKMTKDVIKTNKVVCVETLSLETMVKWSLGKSIYDAAIGMAIRQLAYKSEMYGNWFQKVDRFYPSSKTCFHCKHVNKALKLSDRIWDCPNCGITLNRDFNAAQNIEFEGLRILSAGTG